MDPSLQSALIVFCQVVLIDITLAGDNAVVIGMVARNVEPAKRARVIFTGLAASVVLLVSLASLATRLLDIIGLTLAGGILLLWVSWRLYRELRERAEEREALETMEHPRDGSDAPGKQYLPLRTAVRNIVLADISMSLDNVLAVAAAARDHPYVLVAGLAVAVALMGVAAVFIAKMLQRYPWFAYLGLIMIVYVGGKMIWDGGGEVMGVLH